MDVLMSQIKRDSTEFLENKKNQLALIGELENLFRQADEQGDENSRSRHQKKNKWLARERVRRLLDSGSPFLELLPLAGYGQASSSVGASLVAGIGYVCGRACLISANVPTIKGGAINAATLLKMKRLARIAEDNLLPVISLVESAGADLPNQSDIYNFGGAEFRDLTRRSKLGLPSIAVVFGSSTAGGAYIPGMSDYTIMVENQARVYLAGPPLVKMALGETIDEETLGGARMHATTSGVCDVLATSEADALIKTRNIVENWKPDTECLKKYDEPLYPIDDLLGIISSDLRKTFEMREVIARLVDGSQFFEFKPLFGETLVTGFGTLWGERIGVIANNGVITSECAQKGSQFIQLCNQQNTPLLFLQNITGFMVGVEEERKGVIKHGAKLINAVSNSSVPALTVIVGASYGAGNYGMNGLAFEPRFLFTYPGSKLAVMGPEQLTGVMDIINAEKLKGASAEDIAKVKNQSDQLKTKISNESHAFYGSGRCWDDGVIDPRLTRSVLGFCLKIVGRRPVLEDQRFGVFRM